MKTKYTKLINSCLSVIFAIVVSFNGLAQASNEAPNASSVNATAHQLSALESSTVSGVMNHPVDVSAVLHDVLNSSMNLNSIIHDITASNLAKAVSIEVGNSSQTFNPGSMVTPAEAIAINQVLAVNGHQTLMLDALGQANGGSFNFSQLPTHAQGLVIPANVTVVDNSGTMNLTGSLANFGDIYVSATGSSNSLNNFSINVENLYNAANAVITTNDPSGTSTPADLTITANNDIINAGTISSSHNLTLMSGSDFVNTTSAVLTADNNLNVTSGSGFLQNNGVMDAINGNLLISTTNSDLFAVDAVGGNFEAGQNLTIQAGPNTTNNSNLLVYGGNYTGGDSIKFYGENANDSFVVGNLNGAFDVSGHNLGLVNLGNNVKLDQYSITGDPILATTGSFQINTSIVTGGYDLVIIAGGNITANPSSSIVISTSMSGYGYVVNGSPNATIVATGGTTYNPYNGGAGNVTMIAGAAFNTTTYSNSTLGISNVPVVQLVQPASTAAGGSIILNGVTQIDTQALTSTPPTLPTGESAILPDLNGGNVTLAAYAGTGAGSGTVVLASSSTAGTPTSIITGGVNSGVSFTDGNAVGLYSGGGAAISGNVVILAGSANGSNITPAISVDYINTAPSNITGAPPAGTYYGGSITILNQQPNIVQPGTTSSYAPYFEYSSPLYNPTGSVTPINSGTLTQNNSANNGANAPQMPSLLGVNGNYYDYGRGNPFTNAITLPTGSGSGVNNGIAIYNALVSGAAPIQIAGIGNVTLAGPILTGSGGVTVYSASNVIIPSGGFTPGVVPIGSFIPGIQDGLGNVVLTSTGGLASGDAGIIIGGQIAGQNVYLTTANSGTIAINSSPNTGYSPTGIQAEGVFSAVMAGGGSINTGNNSVITATAVYVTSGTGSIGGSVNEPFQTNAASLQFNTGGNVDVSNGLSSNPNAQQTATLLASSGYSINISNYGALTLAGNLTSSSTISLQTSITNNQGTSNSSGSILLGAANITAPSAVYLTASGAGDIFETSAVINTTNLFMTSTGGSIGATNNPIVTTAAYSTVPAQYSANVTATTNSSGNVYVQDIAASNDIIIVGASNSNVFQLTAPNANISLLGNINAQTIAFSSPNGFFNVNGGSLAAQPNSAGDGGYIYLTASSINFSGGVLQLIADGTGNGNGGNVNVDLTGNIPLYLGNQPGNVYIQANGGSAGSSAGNGGSVSIQSGGSIYAQGGSITANPLGTNGNGGIITINTAGLFYYGSSINLSGVGTGAGGEITINVNTPLPFNVGSPAFDTNGVAGSIVSDSGLQSISGGGKISIDNFGGGFVNTSPVIAADVSITVSAGAQLQVGNTVGSFVSSPSPLVPPGVTTLTSNGSGSIVELSPQPYIIGNYVNIYGTNANIGYGALVINGNYVNIATGGSASVLNYGQTNNLNSLTGGGFIYQAYSQMYLYNQNVGGHSYGTIETGVNGGFGGGIILSTNSNQIIENANITTGGRAGGSVNIYNYSSSSSAYTFIFGSNIDTHSALGTAGTGTISVSFGPYSAANNVNPNPAAIQIQNNGTPVSSDPYVYFGPKGIASNNAGGLNVLNFKGSAIILDVGTHSAGSIVLGGANNFVADPLGYNGTNPSSIDIPNIGIVSGSQNDSASVNSTGALNADFSVFATSANSLLNVNTVVGNTELNTAQLNNFKANFGAGGSGSLAEENNMVSNAQTILPISYSVSNNKVATAVVNNANGNVYKLNSGALLIHTEKNTEILAGLGKLNIKANTLALLISNSKGLTVYNLTDKSANSLVFTLGSAKITVNPGQCVAVSRSNSDFSSINPLVKVGYRAEENMDINNAKVFKADYSLITLINSVPAVKALLHSQDAKVKHLVNDMYKASAIIYQSSMYKGTYHQVSLAKAVAMR